MFRLVVVRGSSMFPTLLAGRRLLVRTGAYRRRAPQRGHVVVVQHPFRALKLVKRIVAVPGDDYAGRPLGRTKFLVRGDNPAASTDSVQFGPVDRADIFGKVVLPRRLHGPPPDIAADPILGERSKPS